MDMTPWTHGGLTPAGDVPDPSVLDLSVNINPYGPDPDLCHALRLQAFDQYPDPQQTRLRQELAAMRGCKPGNILVGNGCNELFWAAARAFLKTGTRWIAIEPNYSEFARAASGTGAQKIDLTTLAADDFRWSIHRLRMLLEQHKPVLVMSSNPCSPTGFFQEPNLWRQLARDFPQVLFALDQSFLSLSVHWRSDSLMEWPDNVLRFHSLTKDFAIAGLRLGYVEAHSLLLRSMQQQIPTWSVNALAQAAGIWIAKHHEQLASSRMALLDDQQRLEAGFRLRSIRFVPSATVFTMFRPKAAEALRERLWNRHRVLVRSCASYGLPDWLRVAARPEAQLQTFWKALDEELSCSL